MAKKELIDEKTSNASMSSKGDEVAKIAYKLFLERGGEHGHDVEDWLKAEAAVRHKVDNRASGRTS